MSKRKGRFLAAILLLLAIVAGGAAMCFDRHSPEYALTETGAALRARDAAKLAEFVESDAFLAAAYDDGAAELAEAVGTLHECYPQDMFFWHDTAFMRDYAAMHRAAALLAMRQALDLYLSGGATKPAVFETDPVAWGAADLASILSATSADIVSVQKDGSEAVATLRLRGSGDYGGLLDGMEVKLAMRQRHDGMWQILRVTNAKELVLPVTDSAERYWTLQGWQ